MVYRVTQTDFNSLDFVEDGRTIYADGTFEDARTVVYTNVCPSQRIEKYWVRTPNYSSYVATGAKLPDNDFDFRQYRWDKSQNIRLVRTDNYPGVPGTHQIAQTIRVRSGSISRYVTPELRGYMLNSNDVKSKIMRKARLHQFNLPVFLAELGKTKSMVIQRATHLAYLAYQLRRGNVAGFVLGLHPSARPTLSKGRVKRFNASYGTNPKKAFSNTWLEYRYGWIPFLLEVQAGLNVAMDLQDRPQNMVGQVRAANTISIEEHRQAIFESGNVLVGDCLERHDESCRIVWRFSPNSSDVPAKLVLTNPLSVAWELIPLSFVADWFVPIGDYLASMDDGLRFTHQGGCIGRRRHTTQTYYGFRSDVWDSVSVSGTQSAVHAEREKLSTIPTPDLSILRFNPKLGAVQVASAIALLRQRLR